MMLQQDGSCPAAGPVPGFRPALVRVEVSADMLSKEETLWVTSWWQNIGDTASEYPLRGYMDCEFGHQRITETSGRSYRVLWDPYPGTNRWNKGELWKTTCRWNATPDWCGSFHLYLGLCGDQSVPVPVIGEDGQTGARIYIGEVQVGWGFGHPMLELKRKPWTKNFFDAGKMGMPGREPGIGVTLGYSRYVNRDIPADREPEDLLDEYAIGNELRVKMAGAVPVILELWDSNTPGDSRSSFESRGVAPESVIRLRKTDQLIYSSELNIVQKWSVQQADHSHISYMCQISFSGKPVCSYTLHFCVSERSLMITMDNVWEDDGAELLEIRLPSLLSVEGKGLHMLEFFGGGRVIEVEKVPPMAYIHPYDTRNAAALYTERGMLAVEGSCLDDKLTAAVRENHEGKRAELGFILVNRVRAKGQVASIPVKSTHPIAIHLLDNRWGVPSWQSAARFFQQGLTGRNVQLYNRALVYKHLATYGPEPQPWQVREDSPRPVVQLTRFKKFSQILDETRQYCNIFDGIPQVLYIGGFQKDGFDSSYPYVLETDPRAGTVEELRNCIGEAAKYNAVAGLHDNYDSCVGGPYYDPDIVAGDESGNPWKAWFWAGGMEYIVSPVRYARSGKMQERVDKTVQQYGLRTSTHIDVLTSELLRYDFNPESLASADLSVQGKYEIIEAYNRYGIDITSETLQHPYIGKMGYALWLRDNRKEVLFPGERYVPLTAMVYHGVSGYCSGGGSKTEMLWALVKGSNYFWEENHTSAEHIQWIYLQNIPLGLVFGRTILDIEENGDTRRVNYGADTYIHVDFSSQEYEIVVDGRTVARNWTTFVPGFRENVYLAYSLEGGDFRYPVPEIGFGESLLQAVVLTLEGEGPAIPVECSGGELRMNIPSRTPVRITACPGSSPAVSQESE